MVLVQASRLPKGLRDRDGSHLDRWLLLILGLAGIPHFIAAIILHVRSPQGEVVTKKLHDQGAILVGLFPKSVQF